MTDPRDLQRRIIHGFQCLSEALRQIEDPRNAHRFGRPIGGVLGHLAGAEDPQRELAARVGISDVAAEEVIELLLTIGLLVCDDRGRLTLTAQGEHLAAPFREKADQYALLVEAMGPEDRAHALESIRSSIRALQEDGRIRPIRLCETCRYFSGQLYPGESRPHHCHLVGAPLGDGAVIEDPAAEGPLHDPAEYVRERARTNRSSTRGRWTRGKV